ncbi:MAG: fibronectin type III domain-containing protein [Flammeovirgaceae bacterium]
MKHIIRALCVLMAMQYMSLRQVAAQDKSFKVLLHGNNDNTQVKLFWEVHGWPKDLQGFNIKRRILNENGEGRWEKLNIICIVPQFNPEQNWANLGLTPKQASPIKEKAEAALASGEYTKMNKGEMLKLLKDYDGLEIGDRVVMIQDYDIALILGFGFIDNRFDKANQYEYALFYVTDHGEELATPLATYQTQNKAAWEIEAVKFSVPPSNQIKLTWEVDKEVANQISLFGFNVEAIMENGKGRNIATNLGGYVDDRGKVIFSIEDEEADPSVDRQYVITGTNVFHSIIKSFELEFKAKEHIRIKAPKLEKPQLVDQTKMYLKWEKLGEEALSNSKAIIVEVLETLPNDEEELVFRDTIPANSDEYTLSKTLEFNTPYRYVINILDINDKQWTSTSGIIPYYGVATASIPSNLAATFMKKENRNFIRLSWDKLDESDKSVYGYKIMADHFTPGKPIYLGSIPLVKANYFDFEVHSQAERAYHFNVVPINILGAHGEMASVTFQMPSLELPPFESVQVELQQDYSLKLKWEYPDVKNLKGFRILVNGEQVASETEVAPKNREWVIEQLSNEGNGEIAFQVEAVGQFAAKKSRVLSKSFQQIGLDEKALMPHAFRVKLVKTQEKRSIELSWDKPADQPKALLGYRLWMEDENGKFIQVGDKLIIANQHVMNIRDNTRKHYKFRLSAVHTNGVQSPYAEVNLVITNE